MKWHLQLECGHTATRPVQTRRTFGGDRIEDPRPKWVYCKRCGGQKRDVTSHERH